MKFDNKGSAEIVILLLVALTFFYVVCIMPLNQKAEDRDRDRVQEEISKLSEQNEKKAEVIKETVRDVGREVKEGISNLSEQTRQQAEEIKTSVQDVGRELRDRISGLSEQNQRQTEEVKTTVRDVVTQNKGLSKFDMGFILVVVGIGLLILLGAINAKERTGR